MFFVLREHGTGRVHIRKGHAIHKVRQSIREHRRRGLAQHARHGDERLRTAVRRNVQTQTPPDRAQSGAVSSGPQHQGLPQDEAGRENVSGRKAVYTHDVWVHVTQTPRNMDLTLFPLVSVRHQSNVIRSLCTVTAHSKPVGNYGDDATQSRCLFCRENVLV